MKIQEQSFSNTSYRQYSFNGLHVTDTKVQKFLLDSLSSKQLKMLSNFVKEQESNSVHILLDSKNQKRLKASLLCNYRLKNFKTEYIQIPIFESKFHFIKRVVKIANKYKQQIKNYKTIKLEWLYSSLPEWKSKMYS